MRLFKQFPSKSKRRPRGKRMGEGAAVSPDQPSAGALTVTQVVEKLLLEKESENLRERSVRDLRSPMIPLTHLTLAHMLRYDTTC
jgi:hypothetical protein